MPNETDKVIPAIAGWWVVQPHTTKTKVLPLIKERVIAWFVSVKPGDVEGTLIWPVTIEGVPGPGRWALKHDGEESYSCPNVRWWDSLDELIASWEAEPEEDRPG